MPGVRRSRWKSVVVTCAGQSFRLRAAPAADWIFGALSPDLSGVFPGLVRDGDIRRVYDLWSELPDMQVRCLNVSYAALGRAGGRDWFWVLNLIQECWENWTQVNGILVRQGVRADEEGLTDWLDAAYSMLMERLDGKGRDALNMRLMKTPQGVAALVTPPMSTRDDLMAFARD